MVGSVKATLNDYRIVVLANKTNEYPLAFGFANFLVISHFSVFFTDVHGKSL